MKYFVHIVPHFHWDREWYFTEDESQILLKHDLDEVIEFLLQHPDYPSFILDGQTSLLEDYLALSPDKENLIKQLVQSHRLIIGPWYTQTDEMVVSGESIVRNLLYGIKDSQKFGNYMPIGYLPDSFGQSSQMPMILQGFGINHCIFWRGISSRHQLQSTEFYWDSDDGSSVFTLWMPLGYAIGKYLPTQTDLLKQRCDHYFKVLEKYASTPHLLLPHGHDQMPIQKNINDVILQLSHLYPDKEFILSDYMNLFQSLTPPVQHLKGEFLDGQYMRVHRSIYSSRSDLKALNTQAETIITYQLEPLMSIAHALGFEYNGEALEKIWKELLKNHAHDSMGCCCSDDVHQKIEQRYQHVIQKSQYLLQFYMRQIADSITPNNEKIVIFNTLPKPRQEVIETNIITRFHSFRLVNDLQQEIPYTIINQSEMDPGLVDRQIVHYGHYEPFFNYKIQFIASVPSMGYETLHIEECHSHQEHMQISQEFENEYYRISFHQNGAISIFDKKRQLSYDQILILEDSSDDGDSYDYSPLEKDWIITSQHVHAKCQQTHSPYQHQAHISYQLAIPKNIQSRQKKQLDAHLNVHCEITLSHDSPFIHIDFQIQNNAKDHRVRVYIPTLLKGSFSIADNQFGYIERPCQDSQMENWQSQHWSERPDSIYPFLSYVSLKGEHLAIMTQSVREYEVINQNIAITLFRSFGILGKEKLLRRPGRPSGIRLETPDSQLCKQLNFSLSLCTYDKPSELSHLARKCLTPLLVYNKKQYDALKMNPSLFNLPATFSLFEQLDQSITISSLKKSEYSDDLILRVFNTDHIPHTLHLSIPLKTSVNLNEEIIPFQKDIKPNQVASYMIDYSTLIR